MAFGYTFIKTRRDFCNLAVLGFVLLVTATVYSIQAPIYPIEAATKGASASEFGLVMGIYELAVLVTCPFASLFVLHSGPWVVFNSSTILIGISTASFGLLGFVDGRYAFVSLSFILRILEGIASAGVHMSAYSLLTREFPLNTSETFGVMEMAFGIGSSVGPILGTILYSVGVSNQSIKFLIPFVTLGIFHFVSAFATNCTLRSGASSSRLASDTKTLGETKPLGFLQLLKMPSLVYFAMIIVIGMCSFGFQTALLSTYLNQVGLSAVQTGAVYLVYGVFNTISNPIFANYAETMKQPLYLTLTGYIALVVVFILYALSAMQIWTVPLIIISAALLGIGHGIVLMTAYVLCMREAESYGHDDVTSVSAQVSALWLSAVSLGCFLGPSIAGIVFDLTNFLVSSIIFLGGNVMLLLSIPVFIAVTKQRGISHGLSETTRLLTQTPKF